MSQEKEYKALGVQGWKVLQRKQLLVTQQAMMPQLEWIVQDVLMNCTVKLTLPANMPDKLVANEAKLVFWQALRAQFIKLQLEALASIPPEQLAAAQATDSPNDKEG